LQATAAIDAAEHPIAAKLHNPRSNPISGPAAIADGAKVQTDESIDVLVVRLNHVDDAYYSAPQRQRERK